MKQPKSVKIDLETFSNLVAYFIYHNHDEQLYEAIRQAVDAKIDRMVSRDIYMETHNIIKKGEQAK